MIFWQNIEYYSLLDIAIRLYLITCIIGCPKPKGAYSKRKGCHYIMQYAT